MNLVVLAGRATKEPEVRYGQNNMAIAKYSIAVDRGRDKGTDFVNITAFDKSAEFAEKYIKKGAKFLITGHIATGSYEKDGKKVHTFDVIADKQEFCESKGTSEAVPQIDFPVDIEDEDLPF